MAMLLAGIAIPLASPAGAQEPPATAQPAPPPNSALTARFTSFFKNVLAGHTPSSGVTDQVKQGLTPDLLAQIDGKSALFVANSSVQHHKIDVHRDLVVIRQNMRPGIARRTNEKQYN